MPTRRGYKPGKKSTLARDIKHTAMGTAINVHKMYSPVVKKAKGAATSVAKSYLGATNKIANKLNSYMPKTNLRSSSRRRR